MIQSLSEDELLALLACARRHRERDFLMILLAFAHGLRASEVVGGWRTRKVDGKKERYLHPGLLASDFVDGYLTVSRAKGSLRTTQALLEHENQLLDEKKALLDWLEKSGKGRLFNLTRQHFWRLVQRYSKEAGIPAHKRHPHVLKHSIAMQTIRTAGIENVRQHLGHKSIASTGEYLKVTDEDASAAVKRALRLKT